MNCSAAHSKSSRAVCTATSARWVAATFLERRSRSSRLVPSARFWDVDGNEFIDYMCGYGPNVLGYGDPEVRAAARAQ